MKPKGIRLLANLILWIGVLAGLLGCIFALLLAQGNPLKVPTEYVPDYVDFIIIGAEIVVVLVIAIILHAVAGRKEKRDRIRACWEAGEEAVAEEAIDEAEVAEVEAPVIEVEVEDVIDAEEPIEECEAVETTEEPKKQNKLLAVRAKIVEKTPLNEKQVTIAGAAILAAIPVALAGIAYGKKSAKLKAYKKMEKRRKEFYNWLG
ncbi:MAG: hypothetical protein IJW29_07420 [Clostridia bacterium]|nr:hypothetical protein [Clostridia bacterium]